MDPHQQHHHQLGRHHLPQHHGLHQGHLHQNQVDHLQNTHQIQQSPSHQHQIHHHSRQHSEHQQLPQPAPPPARTPPPHERPMAEGFVGIYVKTMKERKLIEVRLEDSVKDFRKKIAAHWCTGDDTLCLIYGGRILEDTKPLSDYGLRHGSTCRMVIKQVNKNQAEVTADLVAASKGFLAPAPQKSDITATPFGLGTMGGLAGVASVGMGGVNFMEMQQRLQRELLSNPESLRIIVENPLVRHLMNEPEQMHQLMLANPAMKELIEVNPEITQMMRNKELMSTIANLAHNPAMLQELVRNEDRIALTSSEDIGPSLGVRLPEEDDDIIFMGTAEELGVGSFRSLGGPGGLGPFLRGPWGPRGRRLPPPVSHMFNTAPTRSLLLQMMEAPQVMQNLFSAPYVQTMMSALAANPEMAEFVASQNPALEGNEELKAKIPDLIPHLTSQMQDPAVQGLMTNPKALQALMQIQRGLAALQTEVPSLVDDLAIPYAPKREKTEEAEEPDSPANLTKEGREESLEKTAPKARDPKEELPLLLNQMTNLIAAGVPGSTTHSQPPETKYAPQAKQLAALGFHNREAVIDTLESTAGDVNAAIERLVPKARPAFDL